jgi:heavy metal sensor kinase
MSMRKSIRTRVAVRYSLLYGLLALSIAFGVYGNLQRDAYGRLDDSVSTLLNIVVADIHQEFQEHGQRDTAEQSLRHVLQTVYQTSFPQEQVVVWNAHRLVAYKAPLGRKQADLRRIPLPGYIGAFSRNDLRILTTSVRDSASTDVYRVAVSTWRGDTQNDLAALFRTLAILIPMSVLLAIGAGYVLAQRTLAPLSSMAAALDAITSRNLDARIKVVTSRDEIERLSLRFNQLLERLQLSFQQQQRFMADASHELRTPVSAALTAAQVTLRSTDRSGQHYREALEIVEQQMLRLRRIVEDMFLLARADTDSLPVRAEEFYLDELVAECCRTMRLLAERAGVQLQLVKPLPEVPLRGDSGLIRQAIIILLDNACKFNRPGGRVCISLELKDRCFLRVADTGTGIPDGARDQIFERFFRLDSARGLEHGSGSGLGLAIARWIAEQHGGTLTLECSSPAGSTFVLALGQAGEFRDSTEVSAASVSAD